MAGRIDAEPPAMGNGKFINQKLGKNVSRKSALLKTVLGSLANRKSSGPPGVADAMKKSRRSGPTPSALVPDSTPK
jgi:hypothetical protein